MSDVDKLLSLFNSGRGVAVANRYRVTFNGSEGGDKISFFCDSVTLPGRQILTSDYMTSMKFYKKPYAFANDEVTMSFILTNDWYTWNFLNEWQSSTINAIDSPVGPFTVKLKSQYVKNVTIQHFTQAEELTKTYTLFGAFPVTFNSMELSNGTDNQVLRCSVSLAYDNWSATDGQFFGGNNIQNNLPPINIAPRPSPNFNALPSKEQPVRAAPNFGALPRNESLIRPSPDFTTLPNKEQPVRSSGVSNQLPTREQGIRISPSINSLPGKEQPVRINPDFGPLPGKEQPVRINPNFGPLPGKEQPVRINPNFGPLPRREQPAEGGIDLSNLPRIV